LTIPIFLAKLASIIYNWRAKFVKSLEEREMKKLVGLIGLILLCTLFTQSFGSGVDLTGVGARAQALGGNYRGIAQGWSAMHWNPAGLVFEEGMIAGFSLEFVAPTVAYTPAKSLAGQNFSASSGEEVENEPVTFLLPAAGIAYSTGKFAFGLGFWAPFGLGAQWDLLETNSYNSGYPEFEWDNDLKIVDVHPTIAYKINDHLSIGVGASIILADIMIRKPNFTPNPYIYNSLVTGNALLKLGFLPNMQKLGALDSPYDHLLTDTVLNGDGVGFGGNVGIMFKPTESLSIGIEAKFYNDVPLEGTIDATMHFATLPEAHDAVQPVSNLAFKGMLQSGAIDETEFAILANYYSGGKLDRAIGLKLKTDLPLPNRVGAGFAFTGIENLLISADVAWTEWSKWGVIDLLSEDGEKISALVENWEDGIRAGFGLEYAMGTLKLRGMFYSEPPAAVAATMSPVIPDAGRRNVVGIGVEVPFGSMKLHLSYEKMFIDDLDVTEWVLDKDQTGYDNMAGFYTMNVNNIMLGLDYAF
jgi:long-chain fatty acid transport protein